MRRPFGRYARAQLALRGLTTGSAPANSRCSSSRSTAVRTDSARSANGPRTVRAGNRISI
jgi:hypothetical protein